MTRADKTGSLAVVGWLSEILVPLYNRWWSGGQTSSGTQCSRQLPAVNMQQRAFEELIAAVTNHQLLRLQTINVINVLSSFMRFFILVTFFTFLTFFIISTFLQLFCKRLFEILLKIFQLYYKYDLLFRFSGFKCVSRSLEVREALLKPRRRISRLYIVFQPPLLQTCLIQFMVSGFQRNIVHCTILTLLTVTPTVMSVTYRVFLVWRHYDLEFVYVTATSSLTRRSSMWRTRLRLRACVKAKGGHFEQKL